MKLALALCASLILASSAFPATIYVPDDYPTIQDAINASVNGDTVIVRPGTYYENINFLYRAIHLKSELGPIVTIIDGGNPPNPDFGSVVTFENGEGLDSILEGFTLTNGTGNSTGTSYMHGGGIYCSWYSSPVITNNIIKNNAVNRAGCGIYCFYHSSPTITKNVIMNNTISKNWVYLPVGGGIYCGESSNAIVSHNSILLNEAVKGGGIFCYKSSVTIRDNIISANWADIDGGGIYCNECNPIIINNTISGNSTDSDGGGIFCLPHCSPIIDNNIISGNWVSYDGGGICLRTSSSTITNNTFVKNTAYRDGGGLYCRAGSSVTVSNSIFWDNSAPRGPEICLIKETAPSTLNISHSDVEGGKSSIYVESGCTLNWGAGMIDADPLFADSANDDFHLTWPSPCRNTGDNSAVTELCDFEGDPRIHYGTVDMGADEFYTHLYNMGAVIPGRKIQIKVVGNPGMAPVTLGHSSGIQDPPLTTPFGYLYLMPPMVQVWDLGYVPANGIRVVPATVPTNWQAGDEYFFQALIGPLAPGSVLTNLMTLTVE